MNNPNERFKPLKQYLRMYTSKTHDNWDSSLSPQPGTANNKLQPRFLGPFEITERPSSFNYKLDLPPKSRIHPVFHVSKLRKHVPRNPEQFVNQDQEEAIQEAIQEPLIPDNPAYYQVEYEFEKIIKHSKSGGGVHNIDITELKFTDEPADNPAHEE
ncbi:hypothetical protein KI688_001617 [Linnemannia hyalina]|uniref:Tf2-1-like SH3-like domain-containing protein n=1 Tax=Linnemannia hyalina TaxID=64524 RepID=A0A9P7XVA1_9FUNG|nr:hypothetical protein KI688_001617 [Linnemannia hyalina]